MRFSLLFLALCPFLSASPAKKFWADAEYLYWDLKNLYGRIIVWTFLCHHNNNYIYNHNHNHNHLR